MGSPIVARVLPPGTTATVWPGDKTRRGDRNEAAAATGSAGSQIAPDSSIGWLEAANPPESGALWDTVARPPITVISPELADGGEGLGIGEEDATEILAQLEAMQPDDRKAIPLLLKLMAQAKRSVEKQSGTLVATATTIETNKAQTGTIAEATVLLAQTEMADLHANGQVIILAQKLVELVAQSEADDSDDLADELTAVIADLESTMVTHRRNVIVASNILADSPELCQDAVISRAWEQVRSDCAILYGEDFLSELYLAADESVGETTMLSDRGDIVSAVSVSAVRVTDATLMAFIRKVEKSIAEVKETVEKILAETNKKIARMKKKAYQKRLAKIHARLCIQKQRLQQAQLELAGDKRALRLNASQLTPEEFTTKMQEIEDLDKKIEQAIKKIDAALKKIEAELQPATVALSTAG
jgi:F0F1-type ATP synthase epsilon subunit